MFRMLWHKKALILFLVVLIVLLPQALSRPAQLTSKTILTEITVDKTDNTYDIAAKMVAGEKKDVEVNASGPSIAAAINKMSADTGKAVSFAHCTLIVLGTGLVDENLGDLLQSFLHKTELSNNCAVVWDNFEGGIKSIGAIDKRSSTLEKFYKDYMRVTSTGTLAKGTKESAIFKSGKHAFDLDETQTRSLDFALGRKVKERFVQDNYVLHVLNNKAKATDNDIRINVTMELENYPTISDTKIDELRFAVENKIKTDVDDMLSFTYNQNADVLGLFKIYSGFNIQVDVSILS